MKLFGIIIMDSDAVDEPLRYLVHDVKHLRKMRTALLDSSSAFFFNYGARAPSGPRPPLYRGFMITLD